MLNEAFNYVNVVLDNGKVINNMFIFSSGKHATRAHTIVFGVGHCVVVGVI